MLIISMISYHSGMGYSRCGLTGQELTISLTTDQEEEHYSIGESVLYT